MSEAPINKTGTRLACSECGAEFVVTRGGDGDLTCCDQLLVVRN